LAKHQGIINEANKRTNKQTQCEQNKQRKNKHMEMETHSLINEGGKIEIWDISGYIENARIEKV